MADTVAVLFHFPPDNAATLSPREYQTKLLEYVKTLRKIHRSFWTRPVDKQNVLDLLNPAENTLPYLFALHEQIPAAENDQSKVDALLDHALVLLATFDRVQVRYASQDWVDIMEWTLQVLQQARPADLTPIAAAWLRLDPTAGTFTAFHLRFLQACLAAGIPSQALPILDKNIYAFPTLPQKNVPEDPLSAEHELSNGFINLHTHFTPRIHAEHVLEYYLLGAHVYIGLRNFSRARLFLESVLLTPSHNHATSAFQVEAYKKWVLIGLLAEGKRYPLPRTHDTQVMKSNKALARPYEALAEDFEKRDWAKFQAELDAGTQIWYDDGNLRLVQEAGNALLRCRVLDLRRTYAALPIGRVASHIGFSPSATLQLVTDMIRQGHVSASVTPGTASGDAVLRFHSTSSSTASTAAEDHELEAQTKRIDELVAFIRDADRRLQITKDYVEHQKRGKRGSGHDGDIADQMDLTWDAPGGSGLDDGDEDLMAS